MKKRSQVFIEFLFLMFLFLLISGGCREKKTSPFSKSADDAISTFKIAPGFDIELIAAEPLVRDPVAMSIDEEGRMYVVEMSGMPLNKSGIGKVVILSDSSQDGIMDKRTVFSDSLIMPSGVMRWKKGVLVTDPPKVYYMEDTDGDDVADIKKVLLDGFDTSNLEGNVNNPVYGLDNWIYLASSPGIKGGNIHYAGDTSKRLPEGTVRIRPDHHELEGLAGKTQFGHGFDKWGNHLMLNNHFHIYHEVIAARYLNRNPDLVVSKATQLLADHYDVFSIAINPEYQMLTEIGVFTSACGLTAYLGGAFPEGYNDNVTFVGEPASNIVHVDRLRDSGVTFRADAIFERKEFLASTDPYSRMVNMYVGPDGALYVLDFYRQVIEGPEFMSEEVVKKTNLYNGNEKGRIYRITKKGAEGATWTNRLHLGDATDEELVRYLDDKNIWWRSNSQRLLVDRNSEESVAALKQMALHPTATMGRLHALWTLQGIGKLETGLILAALKHPEPGMRINAIKLAELHLMEDSGLAEALISMREDPDIKVRYQLVCTLGFLKTPEADKTRLDLLFRDINDTWVQIAALSAGSSQAVALLNGVLQKYDPKIDAYGSLVKFLGGIIAKSQESGVLRALLQRSCVDTPETAGWQSALLEGFAQGLANRNAIPAGLDNERRLLMHACLESPFIDKRKSSLQLLKVIGLPPGKMTTASMSEAKTVASNNSLKQEERAGAIDFIALQNPAPYSSFLKELINPQTPIMVQLAAIRALGIIPGEDATKYFLDRWARLTPELRIEAINVFMASDDRVKLLLDRVEAGDINKGSISWGQSVGLRSDGKHMVRARRLLTETEVKRQDVIGQYQQSLQMKGNPAKGKLIYQINCALCHQVAGKQGRAFGPDLGTVHAWPTADILTNILDPNKSIALGFDMWIVKLKNGKSLQGVISSESTTAVTLTNTIGEVSNISRQDIESLSNLGMSAMPVDFENKIDKQQMADLLAFLKEVE